MFLWRMEENYPKPEKEEKLSTCTKILISNADKQKGQSHKVDKSRTQANVQI